MQLEIKPTKIPGCLQLFPGIKNDVRGAFVKTFHHDTFKKYGLQSDFAEDYYTVSQGGVLRGLHFMLPPFDQDKLVYCVYGKVLDAVVDLRKGSPTYGQFEIVELDAKMANMLYVPKGLAHGFYVYSDTAIMMYKVSTLYSHTHDAGILWNSVGIPWPSNTPVLSERDKNLPAFKDFQTPFVYDGGDGK